MELEVVADILCIGLVLNIHFLSSTIITIQMSKRPMRWFANSVESVFLVSKQFMLLDRIVNFGKKPVRDFADVQNPKNTEY